MEMIIVVIEFMVFMVHIVMEFIMVELALKTSFYVN